MEGQLLGRGRRRLLAKAGLDYLLVFHATLPSTARSDPLFVCPSQLLQPLEAVGAQIHPAH